MNGFQRWSPKRAALGTTALTIYYWPMASKLNMNDGLTTQWCWTNDQWFHNYQPKQRMFRELDKAKLCRLHVRDKICPLVCLHEAEGHQRPNRTVETLHSYSHAARSWSKQIRLSPSPYRLTSLEHLLFARHRTNRFQIDAKPWILQELLDDLMMPVGISVPHCTLARLVHSIDSDIVSPKQ